MPRRKHNFKYKKERILLSEVLPYELPISYTNRHFYEFVVKNKIKFFSTHIEWLQEGQELTEIICLLLSLPKNPNRLSTEKRWVGEKQINVVVYKLNKGGNPSPEKKLIPFEFKIKHKNREYRELTVPHPRSQLAVIDFYDRTKETILYYCSLSHFSIRKPARIAKYRFHKDKIHYENLGDEQSMLEESGKEYENIRSFFVYKDFSNIHKFYESPLFHKCEKKYNNLYKLDITKCFDSIYTHSLPWALIGKESVKAELNESKSTFSGRFDALMQSINHGETNGIIIGPEFSRIFAELILQSVDKELELSLIGKIKNRSDYQIFRYVDDYFVFYNSEHHKDHILTNLQHILKRYKLHLNSAKAVLYEKPIITELTRAKQRVACLLDKALEYKLDPIEVSDDGRPTYKGSIYINTADLIIQFKTILKECEVEYKDILNFTLAIIENRCNKILKRYVTAEQPTNKKKALIEAIVSILNFVFFIYSVSPKVNTTIRLCSILRIFTKLFKGRSFGVEYKHRIYKLIYDNICLVLKKNKIEGYTQVETLYLLIALAELGKDYWLEENILAEYFNIKKNDVQEWESVGHLNYFSFTVLLFYMKDKRRYQKLRQYIELEVVNYFELASAIQRQSTEAVMLFFDMLSCPYLGASSKRKILSTYDVTHDQLQKRIIDYQCIVGKKQQWFTTWGNFDFGKELDAKRSQEVY